MTESEFVDFCDAVIEDLTSNVSGLSPDDPHAPQVHRYSPWSPEAMEADGKRHLAVWPVADEAELVDPAAGATGSDVLEEAYIVTVWEPSGTESTRLQEDEDGAKDFLKLHRDVRDRFYVETNRLLGGSIRVQYAGSRLPDSPGSNRWFAVALRRRIFKAYS